jgi:AcrR family transcriptional regulator
MAEAALTRRDMASEQTMRAPRTDAPDTRGDILATAYRLFREIGYRKTTVADIAAELKMSPANVYRFFDSKKSINEGVAERLLGEIADALEVEATRPGATAPARLRALLVTLAEMSEQRFLSNKRMYDMVEDGMAESWDVCERYIARCDSILIALVRDGCARGEFAVEDAEAGARCVHAAVVCYCHPAMMAQSMDHPHATIEQMAEFALRGLGARETG